MDDASAVIDWLQHLNWIRQYTRGFAPVGILDRDDYEAIAELAVWKAAQKWDGPPHRFRAYAYGCLKRMILRALRDTSGVSAYAYERGVRMDVMRHADIDEDKLRHLAGPWNTEAEALLRVLGGNV
jgi:DNA-directed RNA polymerase specialized sigma subunit